MVIPSITVGTLYSAPDLEWVDANGRAGEANLPSLPSPSPATVVSTYSALQSPENANLCPGRRVMVLAPFYLPDNIK